MIVEENPFVPEDLVAMDVQGQRSGDEGDVDLCESSISSASSSISSSSSSLGGSSSSSSSSGEEERRPTRGPTLGPTNAWVDVDCRRCGAIYGQLKDFSGLGVWRCSLLGCRDLM